jgi:glycosyltransferase involved in cell wall biosynthesis
MAKPFFSIIIPTLNEAKYLPKLLTDLSEQTFKDFEVVIVDGSSTDKTVELATTFKSKMKLSILASTKRHVCTQRNLGANSAKAEILIFSDADNRLPPYFLQGLKYRCESEGLDIISPLICATASTPQNNTIAAALNVFLELDMSIKPRHLLESCFLINKECFLAIGGFDETIDYAEGNALLARAMHLGYTAKTVKDPNYEFSFRRLKKYGTAKTISNTVRLQILDLIGIEPGNINLKKIYPMLGGKSYNTKYKIQKNKISKFLKNISKLLKDF